MVSLGKTRASETKHANGKKTSTQDSRDAESLNSISNAYVKDETEFNNIEQVELRMIELNEQYEKTTNPQIKKQIDCLQKTYEIQHKCLLLTNNTKQKTKTSDTTNDGSTIMSPIVLDEEHERKKQINDKITKL